MAAVVHQGSSAKDLRQATLSSRKNNAPYDGDGRMGGIDAVQELGGIGGGRFYVDGVTRKRSVARLR